MTDNELEGVIEDAIAKCRSSWAPIDLDKLQDRLCEDISKALKDERRDNVNKVDVMLDEFRALCFSWAYGHRSYEETKDYKKKIMERLH